MAQEIIEGRQFYRPGEPLKTFGDHPVILPRWKVRNQLAAFISAYGPSRGEHELWAYYGAYDHVMLAQLWGRMINLPPAIPMFTRELMQLEADVNLRRAAAGLGLVERPAKGDEHHAGADAEWNAAFHRALLAADLGGCPEPLPFQLSGDLVTVPSRVFVAGYERLSAKGPNEGLDDSDMAACDAVWQLLL
jgi:hypothetical protein